MNRRSTKKIAVGNMFIGGDAEISVQSMLNVPAADIEGSVKQAVALEQAGCELIRIAVPDMGAVSLISAIKEKVSVPIVADIHFNYQIALECAAAGVDKIRINPGNIGSDDRVKRVADECRRRNIPIRIGVNSGSLEKHILAKYGRPTPQALCDSALYHAALLEKFDFDQIILSHLGVTEAGTERMGLIKSAAGIGSLLLDGIGDTIRVSLTDDPVKEVYAARDILKALGLREFGVKFVSCPTCGRTKIDLIGLAKQAEERLKDCKKNITVAIMGCAVNGPGEAAEADIGIAGGDGVGLLFKKGKIFKKVSEQDLLDTLIEEIEKL